MSIQRSQMKEIREWIKIWSLKSQTDIPIKFVLDLSSKFTETANQKRDRLANDKIPWILGICTGVMGITLVFWILAILGVNLNHLITY